MIKKTKSKLTKAQRAAYAIVGAVGGRAVSKNRKHMSSIGKKGAKARWRDKAPVM